MRPSRSYWALIRRVPVLSGFPVGPTGNMNRT